MESVLRLKKYKWKLFFNSSFMRKEI